MNNTDELFSTIQELLEIISKLEESYGRKFSLDGHLFGSIGEVFANTYYGIQLDKSQSRKMIDGEINGETVQIKITQTDGVNVRATTDDNGERIYPDYLLVFFLKKSEAKIYEVYNGPAKLVLDGRKVNKSGEYHISLRKLKEFSGQVNENKK